MRLMNGQVLSILKVIIVDLDARRDLLMSKKVFIVDEASINLMEVLMS
jgi:hypothetical protein